MKRILSFILALMLTLTSLCTISFAEENTENTEEELTNIAVNGLAYCTSMKHSTWTPPSSINDGTYDWHGWEPLYPTIEPGQDTSAGFSGEYCGIKFLNKEYYEIYEIRMTVGLHALYKQNVTYKIQALVEGVWVDVVTLKDEQFIPRDADSSDIDEDGDTTEKKYSSYEDAMEKDTSNYHIGADITYTLTTPITTNNIRITVSDFGKNFPGGDVLIFPYIYEVELIGKRGITPDIDLPEGAEVSQNAAYNSIPEATSSKNLSYPFLAIDGKSTTSWKPDSLEAGQNLTLRLESAYTIDKFALNFGELKAGQTPVNYKFNIEAYIDGEWQKVADGNSYNEADSSYITEYVLDTPITASEVRIVFPEALESTPTVCEFEVNITGEKTYYLSTRFSAYQKASAAKGNLAILGTAYASANLAPYSDTSFINDGQIFDDSDVWFSGDLSIPVSCGVKLDKSYTVNKVVIYCKEPSQLGQDNTHFNIIATVDGESKIIASGTAYNAYQVFENSSTKYTTAYEFPEGIVTDDIKIEFTRGDSTIPNVMEIEIYSDTEVCSAFDGYQTSEKAPIYTVYTPDSDNSNGDENTGSGDSESNSESQSNTNNEQRPTGENDPPVGMIVGIVCGCVAAVGAIAVGVVFIIKKKRS